MRFVENGPNIPDLLLERRDQGRVVFLCGAGVSFNAGMPTFVGLTKHVIHSFDPPKGSAIASSFGPWEDAEYHGSKTPLDQIFHLLHQEYGREDVNALVAERLRQGAPGEVESLEHKLIARISSDQEGNPQIVTTNFDRLFEHAVGVEVGKVYEPPAFPDIRMGVPVTGVTYLHGRLQEPGAAHHPYILSSADFGRAYLSEGWATSFIRSLLESYTVVLVGYQAEDPPVKYLLQGLNHDGMSDRSNLYAFDKGLAEEIEAKWRDRGVSAIAYNDHSDLWQCLEAWAERANDPRAWRSKLVDLARRGPRNVAAYERGQVAHLVRTTPGARLFANADPSPPAEWLCVFDAFCRASKKSSGYGEDAETFDPLETYGLDDDPPRPPESDRQTQRLHDHLLEWRRGDTNPPTFHRLAGRQPEGFEDIPPRLFHLVRWIIKLLHSPVTAWWALRQNGLHPSLTEGVRRELRRRSDLHQQARRNWNLILEFQSDHRNFKWDHGWFELKDRINSEGWSTSVLRQFEALSAPILSRNLPLGIDASMPPFGSWDELGSKELASWAVKFADTHGEKIKVPDEVLESVFRIAESHLRRASGLLEELNRTFFTTLTCYPGREIDGEDRDRDGDANFRQFLGLFARMVEYRPALLRAHAPSRGQLTTNTTFESSNCSR
ncbi:SIR2 family protein [Mesorhizobium onobrychidis]|uniref:SIR2 family protein n=1 Tax=Mesorhizobium onobrychidis TaxID=2775404 RepID=A0ABY5QS04_9HYPH|nr:SIR2 family protein [Mesorhizobium onobrychidis]UVC13526.1 SIR2 family protein [Mesorhizobium onobrychidis]